MVVEPLQKEFGVGDLSLLVTRSQELRSEVFDRLITHDDN